MMPCLSGLLLVTDTMMKTGIMKLNGQWGEMSLCNRTRLPDRRHVEIKKKKKNCWN